MTLSLPDPVSFLFSPPSEDVRPPFGWICFGLVLADAERSFQLLDGFLFL